MHVAQRELGRLDALQSRRLELGNQAAAIQVLEHNLPVLNRDLASVQRQEAELTEQCQTEDSLIERAELALQIYVCPDCATRLRLDPATNEIGRASCRERVSSPV